MEEEQLKAKLNWLETGMDKIWNEWKEVKEEFNRIKSLLNKAVYQQERLLTLVEQLAKDNEEHKKYDKAFDRLLIVLLEKKIITDADTEKIYGIRIGGRPLSEGKK